MLEFFRRFLRNLTHEAVQGRYDVLAAWSVDRLGRSLQDLLHTLQLSRIAAGDDELAVR